VTHFGSYQATSPGLRREVSISLGVTVTPSKELVSSLVAGEKTIAIAGELKYQVRDKKV
jgi:hypothetical protein